MLVTPKYVIGKESFKLFDKSLSDIRESTNIKMKNASMRALIKKYVDYLADEKSYTLQDCTRTVEQVVNAAISSGNGTQKLYSDVASYIINRYQKKNHVLELHKNIVMEILEDVEPQELPENVQQEAETVVAETREDDIQDQTTEIIEAENTPPGVEIEVETPDPEVGEISNVEVSVTTETEDGEATVVESTDQDQKPMAEPTDIVEGTTPEMLKLMKTVGMAYSNRSLEAIRNKLDPEFVCKVEYLL